MGIRWWKLREVGEAMERLVFGMPDGIAHLTNHKQSRKGMALEWGAGYIPVIEYKERNNRAIRRHFHCK
jgi:hypothetical protein